jgi:hypothetical protein
MSSNLEFREWTKLAKLSLFFELINDNFWHSIDELSKLLSVSPNRLSEMAKLLSEHSLIEYRQSTEEVKANEKWNFTAEEYNEFSKEKQSIGTIIVPPEKSVKLQSTTVTNLTDIALELDIRINKELREITINKIT